MSDRLATSATISVLMMAIYVLFGSDAVRMPIGPKNVEISANIIAPAHAAELSRLVPVAR